MFTKSILMTGMAMLASALIGAGCGAADKQEPKAAAPQATTTATSAPAADADPIGFASVFKVDKEVLVPVNETETYSDVIEVPAMPPQKGMTAVLKLNMRHVSPNFAGWSHLSGIELNGTELGGSAADQTPRLLLRGAFMDTTYSKEPRVSYWTCGANPRFITIYAPADATELSECIIDRENPYTFYFDIDDLASKVVIGADKRVENEEPNRLRFINSYITKYGNAPMLVKDIEFGYVPTERLPQLKKLVYNEFSAFTAAASMKGKAFRLDVSRYGGMMLAVDSGQIYLESAFSYEAEPEMKYNWLRVCTPEGNAEGVNIDVAEGDGIVVTMDAHNLLLKRTIRDCGHRISVVDVIQNKTDDDLGLKWHNDVSFSKKMPQVWRLHGITGSMGSDSSNAAMTNPTGYLADGSAAAGIVYEDTVSRILLETKTVGNTLSMGSKGVGISRGNSLTVEWSIYPLPAPANGYFDMINQIREDWNVNVTIPGPYLIRATALPGMELKFASVAPWFEYADGLDYATRDDYKREVGAKIQNLREKFPGVRLMALIETNLVNFDSTTVPWGNELPLTYGDRYHPKTRYAQYLSPELSAKLNEVTPLRDSLLHDKDGNVMIDTNYVYQKKPWINLMPQPEMGNARFKQMQEQISYLMNEMDFDGIYIDQFNPSLKDGVSYDKWDNYSVTLDKTGKISSRYYNYAITGAAARMELIKMVTSRGGEVLTNGHPITREEQSSGRLSFAEMENDPCNPLSFMNQKPPEMRYQAMGHLASPIILNLRPSIYSNDPDTKTRVLTKGLIIALRNGVIPYYYGTDIPTSGPGKGGFEIANWMLPFTPVKLGEGVLIGKERTIVCVSGTYTVGGSKEPKVAQFDDHSLRVENSQAFKITGKPGEWTVEVKIDDWNQMASIVVQD